MKNQWPVFCSIALGAICAGCFTSCSKEPAASKNADVSAMTAALKSEDNDARINACVELAKAGPNAAPAIQSLIPLLKDNDPTVRRLAAYALGEIGPASKPALPALKEMLNDSDRQVVMQVVNSLRSIDPKGSSNVQNINVSTP